MASIDMALLGVETFSYFQGCLTSANIAAASYPQPKCNDAVSFNLFIINYIFTKTN